MNRRLWILILGLMAGGACLWGVIRWYVERDVYFAPSSDREMAESRERKGLSTNREPTVVAMPPILPSHPVRLAIGGLGMMDERQNEELADLVLAQLSGAPGVEMIERQALDKILHEMSMSLSGLVRAKDAVKVGKLLHAEWFLLGTPATVRGTNSIVIRVVDAKTGIMRDGAVVPRDTSVPKLAAALGEFVQQCRRDAAEARPRVYLALGAFEDVSVNNRQARLPAQLRAYLTAAYQRAQVTLLERDYVSTLLREVDLDLAGLTEETVTGGPIPMQSAFWLVQGTYQSYETSRLEVELELEVRRMLGRGRRIPVRAPAGEELFQKVKEAVDRVMEDKSLTVVPTRATELRAQLGAGRELAHFEMGGVVWVASYNTVGPAQAVRMRRNNEEAIRAFETALLLEPGNREARMCLAACFRNPTILRIDEARQYYRQLIEEPIEDDWSSQARQALGETFRFETAATRAEWFEAAASETTNSAAGEFYRQVAKRAREDAIIAEGNSTKAQELAEARLFVAMQQWHRDLTNGMQAVDFYNTGLGKYVESFGTNSAAAARSLVDLLPRLRQNTPALAPHILAGVVSYQVDTNAPVIAEFERSLSQFDEHPEQVLKPAYYCALISGPVYYWCEERGLYALGAKVIECRMKAAQAGKADPLDNQRKMALAFSYLATSHWQEALGIFESWSNRPVFMGNSGLWGRAFTVVATAKEAEFCRKKLGLRVQRDPRELDFGKSCLCLHPGGALTTEGDDLWITAGGSLMQLTADLQTNVNIRLPIEPSMPVNWITATASNIWVATAGAGLFSLDKASQKLTSFHETDGLVMNFVTQVCPAGDTAWLGYGSDIGGGLGLLDLSSGKFSSFTRSIFSQDPAAPQAGGLNSAPGAPPRRLIEKVFVAPDGEVWFTETGTLRKYKPREQTWEDVTEPGPCHAFALNAQSLFAGGYVTPPALEENRTGLLGLSILSFKQNQWRKVHALPGLPEQVVTTVTADGQNVWLGGTGFVALVDPEHDSVSRYGYVNARAVDRIHVAGGYVWAQFGQHLYRASLASRL